MGGRPVPCGQMGTGGCPFKGMAGANANMPANFASGPGVSSQKPGAASGFSMCPFKGMGGGSPLCPFAAMMGQNPTPVASSSGNNAPQESAPQPAFPGMLEASLTLTGPEKSWYFRRFLLDYTCFKKSIPFRERAVSRVKDYDFYLGKL
ncbi:unnamed protein product [Gongylonema pulchrum]|uniref:NUP50 domain-containing protein n=1 Tax=Gongylonema pulchrum TaxID=637853 RepID=A0A183EQ90_9BILA|nr:unnamed protein product [Gongylonema pulchrum]